MPDTIATLARRLARLDRRVTVLERARRAPYPAWRDLPLTGDTAMPDPVQPPQVRANLWGTLEFSGRIGLPVGRAVDETVVALLPEGYEPAAPHDPGGLGRGTPRTAPRHRSRGPDDAARTGRRQREGFLAQPRQCLVPNRRRR